MLLRPKTFCNFANSHARSKQKMRNLLVTLVYSDSVFIYLEKMELLKTTHCFQNVHKSEVLEDYSS